jgi:hypothetical protein
MLLTGRVRKSPDSKHKRVQLTVENVSSQTISYVEYLVTRHCDEVLDAYLDATIVLDNGPQRVIRPKRKATFMAPNSGELDALLKAAPVSSCKPRLTLAYVEFKDGSCWRPNVNVTVD